MTKTLITNIQEYSIHDGPGIRTLVFFKGCRPCWLMDKAIETNIKVKGGCLIFENGDHVVERFVAMGEPLEDARNWHTEDCITPIILNQIDH